MCSSSRLLFGSISAYHTRSRRLLEWLIHFYASERAGNDSTRERKDKDRATGGIRSSVRRLQSPGESDYSHADAERRRGTGRLGPVGTVLSRSWRGMKADKEQQNDKRPANHRLAMQGTALFSQSRPGPAMQYRRRMNYKTPSPPQTNRSQFSTLLRRGAFLDLLGRQVFDMCRK